MQPKCAGRLAGGAGDAFLDGHGKQRGCHVHGQQQRGQRRRAGIVVGGNSHPDAVLAEQVERRFFRLSDEIECAGQDDGDCAGLCHGNRAGLIGVFEMVGRQRAVARGKGGAAKIGQLVGVELDRQTLGLGGIENARHLRGRKRDTLAEAVDGIGQALRSDRIHHRACDEVDIGVLVTIGFARQRMSAEEGGANGHRALVGQLPCGAQRLGFVVDVQAVSRLDLDRRDAFRDQGVEAR